MNSPHWPVIEYAPNFRETEKIYWCHFVRWMLSLFRVGFTLVAREGLITQMLRARIYNQIWETSYQLQLLQTGRNQAMVLENPYELESEVMKMLIGRDAESLQCAYVIIELDVPGSKKGNRHFLFCKLVNHLCSEVVDARKDGGVQIF